MKDILQWDVVNWSVPWKYWDELITGGQSKVCLELGGREGGLSLWLAGKGFEVVASDVSDSEERSRPLHERYGLTANITYRDLDARSLPYENHFDIIVMKSVLGGIGYGGNVEDQHKAIHEIWKALKPGGLFLFAENAPATLFHKFFRNTFTRWGKSWQYLSIRSMGKMLSEFSSCDIRSAGFVGVFGRTDTQKNILGMMDRSIFNRLTPKSWRYIVYGHAVK